MEKLEFDISTHNRFKHLRIVVTNEPQRTSAGRLVFKVRHFFNSFGFVFYFLFVLRRTVTNELLNQTLFVCSYHVNLLILWISCLDM